MNVTTIAGTSGTFGYRDGELRRSLFGFPYGLCVDTRGDLLVADSNNNCIRRIHFNDGTVSTIAGVGEGFEDGNALTEAKFSGPSFLAVCGDIIYVSDIYNYAVRKIEDGIVSTIAVEFGTPAGIAVDHDGSILVVDSVHHSVERVSFVGGTTITLTFPPIHLPVGVAVSPDGIIYVCTIHGVIARWNSENWELITRTNNEISALAVDSPRNILFVERGSHSIKRLRLIDCRVFPLAGSEGNGGDGDGSPLEAMFEFPSDIAMNGSLVYISDSHNHTIRRISLIRSWNVGKRKRIAPFHRHLGTHISFPRSMRKEILSVMLSRTRTGNEVNPLPRLPIDILFLVFQFLTRSATYLG